MSWSYKIARIAGIDVRVHATFLLLLAWYGYSGYQHGGWADAKLGVLRILLLFLCVLLHEFGHAFAARRYGIRTPDITLYPIGGVARLERMPDNPAQEFVIAVAGPLVNVAIGAALWLALGMPMRYADLIVFDNPIKSLATDMLFANVMLVAFNLIPAFPMDGGRMLRALLALKIGHAKATRAAAVVGQAIAVGFAIIGLMGVPGVLGANPLLLFIAMFVFLGAQQEAAMANMRAAVAGMRIADAMVTHFQTMRADMPVEHASEEVLRDTQPVYPVTDAHLRPLGLLPRNALLQASSGTVGELAQSVPAIPAHGSFEEAFRLMQESGSPVLPVVNPGGQLVGLISLNLLHERARARRA